jgi:hypothetical protein
MRRYLIFPALAVISLAALVVNSSGSEAGPTTVDLSITGSVVAGVTSANGTQEVPFSFTVTNRSVTAAPLTITFTLTGGSAPDTGDYVCPLVGTGVDINPDTPACEPGTLAGHHSTSAAIIVTPTATGTMTVQACVSNEAGAPDPRPGNNCKSLSIGAAV